MSTASSSKRRRKPRRRLSSVTNSDIWRDPLAPLPSAPVQPVFRGRRNSVSPSKPHKDAERPLYTSTGVPDHWDSGRDRPLRSRSVSPGERLFRRRPDAPLAYASLPPTPTSPSPPQGPGFRNSPPPSPTLHPETRELPFSLWDYLREELLATDFDSHQELKWERVSNFLSIPLAIEKVRCLAPLLLFLIMSR